LLKNIDINSFNIFVLSYLLNEYIYGRVYFWSVHLLLEKIKEARVIFPKKKITVLEQFFMENLILSSKKQKGPRLLIFFFQKWAFQTFKVVDSINLEGNLKLFSGELWIPNSKRLWHITIYHVFELNISREVFKGCF
jgi:hypothetical protein